MKSVLGAAALSLAIALPATADEFTDALEAALEAYRAGDVQRAKEEVEFAVQLLGQMKAEGLTRFLPPPLPGWTRELQDTQAAPAALLGGGIFAGADYRRDGVTVTIQLMADSPMVAAMGAMLGNFAAMDPSAKVKRIGRERFRIDQNGEIMGLIGEKVMVQVTGSASEAEKVAYIEAMDLSALGEF